MEHSLRDFFGDCAEDVLLLFIYSLREQQDLSTSLSFILMSSLLGKACSWYFAGSFTELIFYVHRVKCAVPAIVKRSFA